MVRSLLGYDQLHLHVVVALTAFDGAFDRILARLAGGHYRKLLGALLEAEIPAAVLQGINSETVDGAIFFMVITGSFCLGTLKRLSLSAVMSITRGPGAAPAMVTIRPAIRAPAARKSI